MRKRIGIYGASDDALALIPLLEANPEVEVPVIYDPDLDAARGRIERLPPDRAESVAARLTDDLARLAPSQPLHAVIDAGLEPDFASRMPQARAHGVQIVPPLTARLLWGFGGSSRDRKSDLLSALHEVVESYELTVDADELFARMLEIAIGVTGADRGSLMLLDPEAGELRIRVAVGIEPELWPKIRVRVGDGIAGRVALEGRPLHIRGKADRAAFQILRERLDVESALCVPLVHEGEVLAVLNLHHTTQAEAFSDEDFEFVQQLAQLDSQIVARSQEYETLRRQANRYTAVREVQRLLAGRDPLPDRLETLCRFVAGDGSGIATAYLFDADQSELRLAATSLAGGGLGGEYRVALGEGLDGRAAASQEPAFLTAPDGTLAFAALPLVANDRLVGLLSLQAGRGSADRESLLEIAAAAAEEIASAEREARMTAMATKATAINEMGIRMVSAQDTAEVVRFATSSGAMILEADHAVLRLQDPETGRYVIRSYFGSADGRLQERLFRLDKRVSVDVIKRRTPLHVRSVAAREDLAELDTGVRSLMSAPLHSEGRVIGTLAFYDKVAPDSFYATSFSEEDFQIFAKLVSYVERAVENATFVAQARRHRSRDDETGLPNARYLAQRIDEEIARAGTRRQGFALATCRIENFAVIANAAEPPHARRVLKQTAAALRRHLRGFDVPARTAEAEFTVLLPDPGPDAADTVSLLARGVAEEVAKDDDLNEPERIALGFGYAVFPDDGTERDALLATAAAPRIRMV